MQNFGQFTVLPIFSEAERYFEQLVQRFPQKNAGLAPTFGKNKLPTLGGNRMGFSCFKLLVAAKDRPTHYRQSGFGKLDQTFFTKTASLHSVGSPFKPNGDDRMATGNFSKRN
jgi:hypothetical protein